MVKSLDEKMEERFQNSESYVEYDRQLKECKAALKEFKKQFPFLSIYASGKYPFNELAIHVSGWEQEHDEFPERLSDEMNAEIEKLINLKYRSKIEKYARMEKKALANIESIKLFLARDVLRKNFDTKEAQILINRVLNKNQQESKKVGKYDKYFNTVINLFSEDIKTIILEHKDESNF